MPAEHWIEVGRLDEIPRRGARRVTRPGVPTPIAVFRTANDQVFALADRCPHLGGPLSEGIVQGLAVACPLHGWVISLEDGRAEAPDEGCVNAIALKLVEDRIFMLIAPLSAQGTSNAEPSQGKERATAAYFGVPRKDCRLGDRAIGYEADERPNRRS